MKLVVQAVNVINNFSIHHRNGRYNQCIIMPDDYNRTMTVLLHQEKNKDQEGKSQNSSKLYFSFYGAKQMNSPPHSLAILLPQGFVLAAL